MGAVLSLLAEILGSSVARFLAWKAVIVVLFITVLPIIFNNFVYSLLNIYMNFVNSHTSSISSSSFIVSLSGLAAYLADRLGLVNLFSAVMSALALRYTLKLLGKFL